MTQKECLDNTGEAFGVIEAELACHSVTVSPEELAKRKADRLEALAKGRKVKADKKAELKRLATEKCPRGCGHTLSMCVCDIKQAVTA